MDAMEDLWYGAVLRKGIRNRLTRPTKAELWVRLILGEGQPVAQPVTIESRSSTLAPLSRLRAPQVLKILCTPSRPRLPFHRLLVLALRQASTCMYVVSWGPIAILPGRVRMKSPRSNQECRNPMN